MRPDPGAKRRGEHSVSYDYDDEEIIDSQEDIIKDLLRSRNTFLHAQKDASQYESKSKL
jgi:hypothetical protein